MRDHPKKGQPVRIKKGKLKDKTFMVINYMETQYAGKPIHKIKQEKLFAGLRGRGLPLDSDVVFGKLYPEMEYCCVHDSELKEDTKDNVVGIKKAKKRQPKNDPERSA